jgi:hypothetical protein
VTTVKSVKILAWTFSVFQKTSAKPSEPNQRAST